MSSHPDLMTANARADAEGLGLDNSAASHMWRTIIAPTRFL